MNDTRPQTWANFYIFPFGEMRYACVWLQTQFSRLKSCCMGLIFFFFFSLRSFTLFEFDGQVCKVYNVEHIQLSNKAYHFEDEYFFLTFSSSMKPCQGIYCTKEYCVGTKKKKTSSFVLGNRYLYTLSLLSSSIEEAASEWIS